MGRPRKRPTVGLFFDNLLDAYEEQLWRTIVHGAKALDVNLICFLAGPAWGQRLGRLIFELPSAETLDGIIVSFGTLNMGRDGVVIPSSANEVNNNASGCVAQGEIDAFLNRYAPLPALSIGKLVPGVPSVVVDNQTGIRQLVSHLVEVHHRRRIAFIRGPEMNEEAIARFDAYRAALEEHGIPYRPELVCPGDFTRFSGPLAAKTLLDERRVEFDALVGANDYMAIHAMHELQSRGIRIPADVAVVGFDDQRDASSVTPALTTVAQPLREMGRAALDQILALIRGQGAPAVMHLGTKPVLRRSCGCMGAAEQAGELAGDDGEGGWLLRAPPPVALARRLDLAYPWLKERTRASSWAEDLAGPLFDAIEGRESRFLELLAVRVGQGMEAGIRALDWLGVVMTASELARRRIDPHAEERLRRLTGSATELIANLAEQAQAARAYALEQETFVLQHVFRASGVEQDDVKRALPAQLPTLGVQSFYLARLTDERRLEAVLDFHFALNENVRLDSPAAPYPAKRLLPGRFSEEHRYAYLLMPLHYGAEQTGFVVCEIGNMSGTAYESLVNQLGRAFKASSLMNEVRRYAGELEQRVEERAQQLKEAQQHLVEIAHEAGMAEIAVGAMHNIGNLLNSVNVSAESISRITGQVAIGGLAKLNELLEGNRGNLAEFFAQDPRAGLIPDYCRQLATSMEADQKRVQAEAQELLDRMALIRESIRMLQDFARLGQDSLLTEKIELPMVIEAALRIQAVNTARHHVRIHKELGDAPPVLGQRFKIIHVLVNLLKNAVEAMHETPEDARLLSLRLGRGQNGTVLLRITDSGEGIARESLDRIFTYGFTTKPDGHGFGLHACANYLKQMGGGLAVESDGPGRGASFTLSFSAAA